MDTTKVAGHTHLFPDRVELDSLGTPLVFAALAGGIGRGTCALSWADSVWAPRAELGYGVGPIKQVVSLGAGHGLVWSTLGAVEVPGVGTEVHLVMSRFGPGGFGLPDTLGLIRAGFWLYAGAVAGPRRWVVDDDGTVQLFAWYSDSSRVWHRLVLPWGQGAGDFGVAVAPLDDSTAVVAYASRWPTPLRWGLLQGDTCVLGGDVPAPAGDGISCSPSFRRSPSGALWLGWSTDYPYVRLARYRDAAWGDTATLQPGAGLPRDRYASRGLWLSRDTWELPTVMWVLFDTYGGWTGSIYVSVPDDAGFPVGELVPGSLGGDYGDVTRDRNGDVWVVWETEGDGMFWTHSYTRATCSAPEVSSRGSALSVSWKLSELAPETWWAVERARDGEPFSEVARVRAGATTEMSWADPDPEPGPVRYRIRRECLDSRYQWWGAEDGSTAVEVSLVSAQASPGQVRLTWHSSQDSMAATVYRCEAGAAWSVVGNIESDGTGQLVYEDDQVSSGARYGYRLGVVDQGREVFVGEAWVDVPLAAELALGGVRPNPASGELAVEFSLPDGAPARLEAYDLAGRRVAVREVGPLGGGSHVVRLGERRRLSPGVYQLRLSRGERVLTARAVVVR